MAARLTPQLTSFLRPLDADILLRRHMETAFEALRNRRTDIMRLLEVFLSEPIVDWDAQTRKLSVEQRAKLEADADAGAAATLNAAGGAPGPDLTPTQLDGAPMGGAAPGLSLPPVDSSASASARAASRVASRAASQRQQPPPPQQQATGGLGAGDTGAWGIGTGGGGTRLTKGWASLRLSIVASKLRGGNAARTVLRDLESSTQADVKRPQTLLALEEIVLGPTDSLRRRLPAEGLTPGEQVDVLVELATDPNVLGRTYAGWAPWL